MSELSKEQCEEIRARAERAYLTDADMRAFDTHAKKDIFALLAEIARLNALLADAREGLKAALTLDDLYTMENVGSPHESSQATADISGVVKVISAVLAKLGA